MYVLSVCHICVGALRGQKRIQFWSWSIWVLGIELESSGRVASTFNCRAISQAPHELPSKFILMPLSVVYSAPWGTTWSGSLSQRCLFTWRHAESKERQGRVKTRENSQKHGTSLLQPAHLWTFLIVHSNYESFSGFRCVQTAAHLFHKLI